MLLYVRKKLDFLMYPTVNTLAKIVGINSRSKRCFSWAPLYCSDAEKATVFTSGISQVVDPRVLTSYLSSPQERSRDRCLTK